MGWLVKTTIKSYGRNLGVFDAGTLTYMVFRELLDLLHEPAKELLRNVKSQDV